MSQSTEVLEFVEQVVEAMLAAFDIDHPPIPVELMLQRPGEGLWPEVDISEMSATFLNLHDRFAPRMSVVRLLARNVARSSWGKERGLEIIQQDSERIHMLARAIVLPRRFLGGFEQESFSLNVISTQFEVPEVDVRLRLQDLGYSLESDN